MKKLILLSILLIVGCAPTFSNLQSAKMVEKGNFELTPSFTRTFYTDYIGFQVAYGLHERFNLRLRYEQMKFRHLTPKSSECSSDICNTIDDAIRGITNNYYWNFGIKLPIKKIDTYASQIQTAIYLPISFFNGSPFAFEPTFLFTIGKKTDMTLSIKPYISINNQFDSTPIAYNFGFGYKHKFLSKIIHIIGLSNFNKTLILRPEVGIIKEDENVLGHISLGLSIYP